VHAKDIQLCWYYADIYFKQDHDESTNQELRREQAGFQKISSCLDQIIILQIILEYCQEFCAFDSLKQEHVWRRY
jgi:hypothetical protein